MGARNAVHGLAPGLALVLGCGSPREVAPDAAAPAPVVARSPRVEPRPEGHFAVVRGAVEGDTVRSVVLGDCNDDGLLDVVTLNGSTPAELFVGRPGPRFERVPGALPGLYDMAGVFADLDGDGHEDLIVGSNALLRVPGLGECRFGAPVVVAGATSEFSAQQVLVTDVNLDGRADLSVTQGRSAAAPHRLLMARGDGTFDEFTPHPTPFPSDRHDPLYSGFSMFYEDLDGDGAMDLFAMLDGRQAWFSWGVRPCEIEQSRDEPLGRLLSVTDPMSLSPLDFDRDGRVDWFLSGATGHSRLLHAAAGRGLDDVAPAAGVQGASIDHAWGSYSFDADLDGWPDLLTLREGNGEDPTVPLAPGPIDLFLNRHDGTFASAGAATIGLSLRAKGLACGPLSNDGPVGCFAIPDDAGPVFLVNGLRARGRQALVRLRGAVSAFDATGARVSVDGASPPMVFAYGGQSSYGAENARVLQVPLGDRESAAVTVRWPSGIEQRGVAVVAGRVTEIREPEAVTLSRRVAPADGRSTVEVTLDAGALGGADARVDLAGAGAWEGEPVTDARGTHRLLRAPSRPGEARIVVTVGGVPLRVHPRVLFAASPP